MSFVVENVLAVKTAESRFGCRSFSIFSMEGMSQSSRADKHGFPELITFIRDNFVVCGANTYSTIICFLELNLIQTSLAFRINIWPTSQFAYFHLRDESDSANACLQHHLLHLYIFQTNTLLDHTLSFPVEWPRFPDCQASRFVSPVYK